MTMLFWFLAWALTLAVLGVLVWPLLKRQSALDQEETDKRLSVYRQQFAELDADLKNAVVTEAQYRQSKAELERRLLQETAPVDEGSTEPRRHVDRRLVAVVIAVLLPTASGLLYWKYGNPAAITQAPVQTTSAPGADANHDTSEGLEALSEKLKQRLEKNPGDGVGWALLARSYVELGRHTEAVAIYEKALALIPDDAQVLADYADALGVMQGRKLNGKPEELIQRALKIDPNNVKALMLAGTISFDRKEYKQAARQWEQAMANFPPDIDNEFRQELVAGIAEAKTLAGEPANGPGAARVPAASANPNAAITGTVTLSPGLVGKGAATDTLFVFARAADGPPMPVAIVRASMKDLPYTFRLDDTNSPMPARKLSEAGTVVIVARVSKSGEAMPKSGDLEGKSQPVRPGAERLAVVIDRVLP